MGARVPLTPFPRPPAVLLCPHTTVRYCCAFAPEKELASRSVTVKSGRVPSTASANTSCASDFRLNLKKLLSFRECHLTGCSPALAVEGSSGTGVRPQRPALSAPDNGPGAPASPLASPRSHWSGIREGMWNESRLFSCPVLGGNSVVCGGDWRGG